eukprot:2281314-Rhodomonas_salina.2
MVYAVRSAVRLLEQYILELQITVHNLYHAARCQDNSSGAGDSATCLARPEVLTSTARSKESSCALLVLGTALIAPCGGGGGAARQRRKKGGNDEERRGLTLRSCM